MDQLPKNLLPDEASPECLNKGDNAWQLTAATLVGLQSIPGLVILYGSLVHKKWAINSAFMAFYAFAVVLVCSVGWAYRMSFDERLVSFLGKPNPGREVSSRASFLRVHSNRDNGVFSGRFCMFNVDLDRWCSSRENEF